MRTLIRRCLSLFRVRSLDEELDQELRSHVELAIESFERKGMSPGEARREAHRIFGGIAQTSEIYREQRGLPMIETFLNDLRYGLRMLARSPGFTAVAVLSLALGIGANTAIFTLIDAVLLKMLPVHNPQELVLLRWVTPVDQNPVGSRWINGNVWDEHGRGFGTPLSYPAFRQIRARGAADGGVLADVFAFAIAGKLNILADGEGRTAFTQMVSANYFSALGVRPALGRTFVESDDQPGASPVCVISERYWNGRFGGDPAIVGKAIAINSIPFTIAGVTRGEFFGLQPGLAIDVSVPLAMQRLVAPQWDPAVSLFNAADHWWLTVMGRLLPRVSAPQAAAALDILFQQSIADGWTVTPGTRAAVPSLELVRGSQGLDQLRRQYSRPLFLLMGLVALVLVIACTNVANLLLARAASRQKEIGVRLSLGAPRGRLIRQLLTESVLLSSIGGVLGLALASWGSRLLVAFLSEPGNPLPLNVSPDLRILGFTAAACLVTGLLFGVAPAFRATRVDLTPALKRTMGQSTSGGTSFGLAKSLMIGQAALSLVLLFGAGLFVRTLVNLQSLDTGFDQQNLLLFGIDAVKAGYQAPAVNDFYTRVQQRLATLPGVVSATASMHPLLSGSYRDVGLSVPGNTPQSGQRLHVRSMPAGPAFFHTMKIPLLRGRDFTERDDATAPKVAVVNQAFVKLYFAGRDPLGQRISLANVDMEIVGVARDSKYYSLRNEAPATVYNAFRQQPSRSWMHFVVRTAGNPHMLIPDVRRLMASLDRSVPVFDVKTQTDQIEELLMQERLFARLSGFFGLLALLLASVGLYGILSYAVARRTGELGIRMALGARRWDIVGMVLKETMLVVAASLALGIPASLLASRLAVRVLSDLLYGLKATDAATLAMAAAALVLVAAFAGFLPARRASLVDPMVALRDE